MQTSWYYPQHAKHYFNHIGYGHSPAGHYLRGALGRVDSSGTDTGRPKRGKGRTRVRVYREWGPGNAKGSHPFNPCHRLLSPEVSAENVPLIVECRLLVRSAHFGPLKCSQALMGHVAVKESSPTTTGSRTVKYKKEECRSVTESAIRCDGCSLARQGDQGAAVVGLWKGGLGGEKPMSPQPVILWK